MKPTSSQKETLGPFGPADHVLSVDVREVSAAYYLRFHMDLSPWLGGLDTIDMYACRATGYRFWRPASIAGDEAFYRAISIAKDAYYREERWEYALVRKMLTRGDRLVEVGCGHGHFLRSVEGNVRQATGLEFNREAIENTRTAWPVLSVPLGAFADAHAGTLDVVCSFQVLEHVVDPRAFLQDAVRCLRPGGLLALSTPNAEAAIFERREDPLDLPPHHVGHFSKETYTRLAELLDLEVVDLVAQTRISTIHEPLSERTRNNLAYKVAITLARRGLTKLFAHLDEPGHTLLAVLRKPSHV